MRLLVIIVTSLLVLSYEDTQASCPASGEQDSCSEGKTPQGKLKHINVILIGATGDLAQKYLWTGLFQMFRHHYTEGKQHFQFYGCGRKMADTGRQLLSEILLYRLLCSDDKCRQMKSRFVQATQYHSLATTEEYEKLARKVSENTQSVYGLQGTEFTYEEGRIVYISTAPSAYREIITLVHAHLRPQLGKAWMKLVFEKPFGHDLDSAVELTEKMKQDFSEAEVYLLDHYIGKSVVQQILPFRMLNHGLYGDMWNRDHIERVEIVLKEQVDVKDRTRFYDEVGVIRDVMQSHLMELLVLVAMEPSDSASISDILERKLELLRQVQEVDTGSVLIGQYRSYDSEQKSSATNTDSVSLTPTFAAVSLHVDNQRWHGVPFLLVSGKKMDEKSSYIRIIFKNSGFCFRKNHKTCDERKQIIFYIGGSDTRFSPMIVVSKSLLKPKPGLGWRLIEFNSEDILLGQSMGDTYQLVPEDTTLNSYSTLIEAMYDGQKHMFVETKCLLASWRIWMTCLMAMEKRKPRLYEGGDTQMEWLDFTYVGDKLEFVYKEVQLDVKMADETVTRHIPGAFRSERLVTGRTDDVITQLANDMRMQAERAVRKNGVFHLAVSGGNSPLALWRHMTSASGHYFPWWGCTHVWMVDERCVSPSSNISNFYALDTHLLRHIGVPHWNIHPMITGSNSYPDDADIAYESAIKGITDKMDFVLLGVGSDGHTASLFPGVEATDPNKWVVHTVAGPGQVSPHRLSMTETFLNAASHVAVLVSGVGKHDIVKTLAGDVTDKVMYPIIAVKPHNGTMTWYIDHDALFGLT